MPNIDRRLMLKTFGISALGMSALGVSFGRVGLADDETAELDISDWIEKLHTNSVNLGSHQVSALHWQEAMDQIYAGVPMNQLKQRLDFESLRKTILDQMPADRGELFHRVELQATASQESTDTKEPRRALITKVAHVRKGSSIPPHGHSNMVSAFLCVSGEFEVRQYDRLEDQDNHMIVRQTVHDKNAGVGTWSSISDYRNNIHWLTAKTNDCYLFTSKLINVEDHRQLRGRINIDIHRADQLGTDTFKAPKITSREAAELF
ncbi:hypothetical protein Pla110_18630 [Polystyrenella longa]|uniref:Cysteine dioxygenase n=1 Tax=Polystyrenella longa TaxID=2528007 RepID=A0A518CLP0_9PLAN|nr:hypothetical protein [Polystyrenella longa]QDU80140.1 hypothetical protein Pla110_18630 [Polystyrenella longa]